MITPQKRILSGGQIIIIGLILSFMLILVWNIVVNVVTKKDVKELKQKQQKDLEEQIKKESGWK